MDNTNSESTEQRILDAAHEVFVQKGMDGAKMQEIADRAGINKALLHYYYRSKEKLYEQVVKAVISRAIPIFRRLLEEDLPLREKLERVIELYVDLISRNPFVPLFIISEINKHPERFRDTILPKELPQPKLFISQVEAEIAAGRIQPTDPRHLILNVVSMCIFPFIAKPMARLILGMEGEEARQFFSERATHIKSFVIQALWGHSKP